MSVTPQEVVHRMKRLRLGPPFAGFARLEATVDAQEFNKSRDWNEHLPCQMRLVWRHGSETRAMTHKFKASVFGHTTESLDAFLRTKVRGLLLQMAKMAEVTTEP